MFFLLAMTAPSIQGVVEHHALLQHGVVVAEIVRQPL